MCSGVAGNLPRTWALPCDVSGKSRRNHAMFAYQILFGLSVLPLDQSHANLNPVKILQIFMGIPLE
jgi:hypothetical protein